jgi:hypothetical protein
LEVTIFFRTAAWLALVFFTALLTLNSLPYFSEPRAHGFVWEKGALADNSFWLGALVIHVGAGVVCLLSSFLQFFRPLLRKAPGLHRWLGRIYVFSVLVLVAPTGFYLAFYAHGGIAGVVGFLLLGILTTGTTWKGWMAMRRKRMTEHVAWMIRSFAMVTTALTFRIAHILFQELGIAPETGFLAALYLSIGGNALAAEWLLLTIRKTKSRKQNQTKYHETKNDIPMHAGLS